MLILQCPALPDTLRAAYDAFRLIVSSGRAPFGVPERALGASRPDPKHYLEFGDDPPVEIPYPLRHLRESLCRLADLNEGLIGEATLGDEAELINLVDRRNGPLLRLSWYPGGNGDEVNYPHTDIDLYTILPAATGPGLEVRINNEWVPVDVSPVEAVCLPGEFLQHFGGVAPAEHRVVTRGSERMSASLFVNAEPSLRLRDGVRVSEIFHNRIAAVRPPVVDEKI